MSSAQEHKERGRERGNQEQKEAEEKFILNKLGEKAINNLGYCQTINTSH